MSRGKLGMFVRVLAVCGLLLFLGGIGLGVYLIGSSLTASIFTSPAQTCHGCSVAPGTSFLNLSVSDPTISDSQTDTLTAYFDYFPQDKDPQNIPIKVTLSAPDFNPAISERVMSFSRGSGTVSPGWVLSPTKPGTFKVQVQVEMPLHSITDVQYIGITVTNVFGLNPWQIQLLSYLGTFLGPLLTAAWWYDKWQERKRRKSDEAGLASTGPRATVAVTRYKVGSLKSWKPLEDTTKPPKPHRRTRQKR